MNRRGLAVTGALVAMALGGCRAGRSVESSASTALTADRRVEIDAWQRIADSLCVDIDFTVDSPQIVVGEGRLTMTASRGKISLRGDAHLRRESAATLTDTLSARMASSGSHRDKIEPAKGASRWWIVAAIAAAALLTISMKIFFKYAKKW